MKAHHSIRPAIRSGIALSTLALAIALPAAARAQEAAEEAAADEEIVVTGTNIRGQAPVGSNAISLGESKLEEVAAQSSNELLASIPQVTNYFNRVPIADLGIAVNQIQISRPQLAQGSTSGVQQPGEVQKRTSSGIACFCSRSCTTLQTGHIPGVTAGAVVGGAILGAAGRVPCPCAAAVGGELLNCRASSSA